MKIIKTIYIIGVIFKKNILLAAEALKVEIKLYCDKGSSNLG
jgi:hypothetical protein